MPERPAASPETRRRILDAAAHCFAAEGYRRARIEDVARRAGVSRALVYEYFSGKAALLRAVRDEMQAGWRAAVEPRLREADGALGALQAMVRETLRYARPRPFLKALLDDDVRALLLDPEHGSRPALAEWRERLRQVLRAGVQAGELRPDLDVEASADVLRAMQLGIIDRMHRPEGPIEVSDEAHVEAAVTLLCAGLAAPGDRRARRPARSRGRRAG